MSRKIVIVEDDADTRQGLAVRLRADGWDVATAADAQGAVPVIQREKPSIVLLDLGLPAGDGFSVLERLGRLGLALPVVVLTARAASSDHDRARRLGAVEVLVKPPDNEVLLATLRRHALPERAAPEGQGAPSRVLVIEDDADTRLGLQVRLRAAGYEVSIAGDAATAMTRALAERPQLVLLDLGLPAGDGFVVLERLKRNPVTAAVPVIVLSARDPAANAPRALQAGAVAFMQKPPDNAELLAAIAKALGRGTAG